MGTRLPRLLLCALAAALMALLAAPVARADNVQQVFQEYQNTGSIDACKHSAGSLGVGVGNDLEQYATDFVDALRSAQLAHSRCGGGSSGGGSSGSSNDSTTAVAPPGGRGRGGPRGPKPGGTSLPVAGLGAASDAIPPNAPITPRSGSGGGTPGPIVILAVLAALLLLAGVPALFGRYFGYGFSWLAPLRHVFGEGALRLSSAGGGVADWLRLDARRRTA